MPTKNKIACDQPDNDNNNTSDMKSQQQQEEEEPLHRRISQSRKNHYEFLLGLNIPSYSSRRRRRPQSIPLPYDIYQNIVEYLPPFPLHGKVERKSRRCHLKDDSCQTDADGMIHAKSRQPLPHLQFFRFRSVGFKVGFGVTTCPEDEEGGIRLNEQACGFLVSTKCFHFGSSTNGKENITSLLDWLLRTHYHSTDNTMGLAVDYERNQILVHWPNRLETLRLDLPPQFQNKLLYPMVQVWGGSQITVLPERIMADALLLEKPATLPSSSNNNTNHLEDDASNSSFSSSNTSLIPTTLPLTQSISQDSWCSEWISLCKSRGLPRETVNTKRWASLPAEAAPQELKSILRNNRVFPPIVDELDDRLPNSGSMTSMATLRTRRASSPHPHGLFQQSDRQYNF